MFVTDGDSDEGLLKHGGYIYFVDNENLELVMLDRNLVTLKTWDVKPLFGETRLQGITFDGTDLWLSAAGDYDLIVQIDASSDSLIVLRSFDAPPNGRGTIRDMTWDGTNLWAVNSGSSTYNFAPTLYKMDPENGSLLDSFILPSPEPRAIAYVGANGDVYGRSMAVGIYYGDVEKDSIFVFMTEKRMFDKVFASPVPLRGEDYIFPVGLAYDGADFWVINSSSAGDQLYRLDYRGNILDMIELPFVTPGPIVWADFDVRNPNPPAVLAVSPNSGSRGMNFSVTVIGSGFIPGTGLDVSFGEGITVSNITFIDGDNLEVDIEIAVDAAFGSRDVTVINPDGQSGTGSALFTISTIDPLAGYIWMANAENDSLYKIKVLDSTIVQVWDILGVAPGGSSQGLAFDGTNIWMSDGGTNDKIIKLNTGGATLSILKSITAPPNAEGTIREIAFDGTDLWACNSTTAQIYKIDTASGALLDSVPTPGSEARGIVFANGELYCNDRTIDSVFVYSFDTQTWTAVFSTPIPPNGDEGNRYATGMSWDGVNFWIANSTYEFDYIFQVTVNGTVLRTYDVPDQGDAQPSGIVFTQD